jgi:Protein O-mannosyl-transferase TMEM260-like
MTSAARERLASLAAFGAPLLLYACTTHRFVGFWDVGEMDTVPYILGIAHPPGLPLYTLAGWAFSHAFVLGSVALRMSLLSALAMSVAAWSVYAIVNELRRSPLAGASAALLFACGEVAWNVGTRADVHALAIAAYALTLLLWLRWFNDATPPRLYTAAAMLGCAVATHPIGLFLVPAALWLVIARLHEIEFAPLARAAAIVLVTASIWFLYLPLRSAYVTALHLDPASSLGLVGGAFWDYDHPAVASNLIQLVFASDVDVAGALHGFGSSRFVDGVVAFVASAGRELTVAGAIAALWGAIAAWRTAQSACVALLLAGAAPAVFGCAFADESDATRYFLPAFAVAAVFAGYALTTLRAVRLRAAGTVLLAVCVVLVASHPRHFADASDRTALQQTETVFAKTPADAILVASWTLAPTLAYRIYVDRAGGDRTVLAGWYGDVADRVGAWSAHRPVYVVGTPEGSVPGFRLERLSAYPELYRVERATANL